MGEFNQYFESGKRETILVVNQPAGDSQLVSQLVGELQTWVMKLYNLNGHFQTPFTMTINVGTPQSHFKPSCLVVSKIYNHLIGNQTKVCQGVGGNSYKVELYIAKRYKNQIKSSFGRKRRYQKFFLKCVNTKQTLIHSYI